MTSRLRYTAPMRPCSEESCSVRTTLRGQAQAVPLREPLDVPSVKELDSNVRVEAAQLPDLPVLACHERLLHDGDLDEQVLLGKVEVRRERAHDAPLLVSLEHERLRLVVPADPVVIEDLGALELAAIGEPRRSRATICLENGTFDPH